MEDILLSEINNMRRINSAFFHLYEISRIVNLWNQNGGMVVAIPTEGEMRSY